MMKNKPVLRYTCKFGSVMYTQYQPKAMGFDSDLLKGNNVRHTIEYSDDV